MAVVPKLAGAAAPLEPGSERQDVKWVRQTSSPLTSLFWDLTGASKQWYEGQGGWEGFSLQAVFMHCSSTVLSLLPLSEGLHCNPIAGHNPPALWYPRASWQADWEPLPYGFGFFFETNKQINKKHLQGKLWNRAFLSLKKSMEAFFKMLCGGTFESGTRAGVKS